MVGEAKPLPGEKQLSVLSLSKSVAHFAVETLGMRGKAWACMWE